jgi:hypothetical protein
VPFLVLPQRALRSRVFSDLHTLCASAESIQTVYDGPRAQLATILNHLSRNRSTLCYRAGNEHPFRSKCK